MKPFKSCIRAALLAVAFITAAIAQTAATQPAETPLSAEGVAKVKTMLNRSAQNADMLSFVLGDFKDPANPKPNAAMAQRAQALREAILIIELVQDDEEAAKAPAVQVPALSAEAEEDVCRIRHNLN